MKLDLPALESWLREVACVIRGPVDAPNLKEYILPLSRFFNSPSGKRQALNVAAGLAQQHLNVGAVRRTRVPLPLLREQREIAAQLPAADAKLAAAESRRSALTALFQSLLPHLLTGQVRLPEFAKGNA